MFVFDFDGVIADSLEICARACRTVAATHGCSDKIGSNPFSDINPTTFEELAKSLDLDPKTFAHQVSNILDKEVDATPIFDGMSLVIAELSSHVPIAVLSASQTHTIKAFLNRYHLMDNIVSVIGGDVPGAKPEKLAGLRENTSSGVLAMVGDSASDMVAAKSVPTFAVGVKWGWQSEIKLLESGADFVADTPNDLLQRLKEILRLK